MLNFNWKLRQKYIIFISTHDLGTAGAEPLLHRERRDARPVGVCVWSPLIDMRLENCYYSAIVKLYWHFPIIQLLTEK